jgi:hypothetical protein
VDRDVESVRIARFGHQFLRAFDVVRIGLEAGHVAEELLRHELARRHRLPFHHAVDDRLAD